MKKLLLVLAIGAFAACGEGTSTESDMSADTTSTSTAPITTDTSALSTDTTAVGTDTTATTPAQ